MKNKFTQNDNHEEAIDQALRSLSEEIDAPAVFKSELEQRLVTVHQARSSSSMSFFKQALPMLGWTMGLVVLALFLNWVIRGIVPTPPVPAAEITITPPIEMTTVTPNPTEEVDTPTGNDGYDWRGTKLYLAQSLPASPSEAEVLLLKDTQQATIEQTRAMAQQFGIEGEIFEAPGKFPNSTDYLVTDGKQRLSVQSDLLFDYYADYNDFATLSGGKNITFEQASAAIDSFLKSSGFDFKYEIENASLPGVYYVIPLLENGSQIRFDYNLPERLEITINDNGEIMLVSSILVDHESLGAYPIITAEEALQKVLGDSNATLEGLIESVRSGEVFIENNWQRVYAENETVTIYGQPIYYPSFEAGHAGFFAIGQYTATGNTSGLENLDRTMVVEAKGQFFTENEIRRFNIESWSIIEASHTSFTGTLRRDGEETILTTDTGNEYGLQDIPTDVPLEDPIIVNGFITDSNFVWTSIQQFVSDPHRGGGGGGTTGFYKLNLSGTPVPFPSPTPQPEVKPAGVEYIVKEGDTVFAIAQAYGVTPDEIVQANDWLSEEHTLTPGKSLVIPAAQSNLIGQRLEGQRGIFYTTIYKMTDGSQRVEYTLDSDPSNHEIAFAILEGNNLQDLEKYHNRPVAVWGTIVRENEHGVPVLQVERYEIPFPDLKIQILEGTQRITVIDRQEVALFTASDGTTYAEISTFGVANSGILGHEGDVVILESLAIPGETFGDYPALRVFSGSVATNPKNNQPIEMTITADQPYLAEEMPGMENVIPSTATIETVELVYYVPDPRYSMSNSDTDTNPQYIQPVWRFQGHYSSGDEFEFLIQALTQDNLLPELAPYRAPG